MIVILDSNALLMIFQFGINLESELSRLLGKYEAVVPITVKNELGTLKDRHAKTALSFSERYRTVSAKGNADDSILELAEKEKGVVVTNDRILKKRLREKNIPVVFLRAKTHLEIEGRI